MNQKALALAHANQEYRDAQQMDQAAQQVVDTATAAVAAATKALDAAEHAEAGKLGDLQSAIDDALDAEQKASRTYSQDLIACPSEDAAEQAAGHAKLLRQALTSHTETIDWLLKTREM